MRTPSLKYSVDDATHVPAPTHAGWTLALGETVVWQGRPRVRVMAERVLYAWWITGYFAALVLLRSVQALFFAGSLRAVWEPLVPAAIVALIVAVMAFGLSRTTHYVVTTRRIVVRYGAALPRSLSVPFSQITSLSLSLDRSTCGDIAFDTRGGLGVPALKLWPHLRRAKPHIQLRFRGIPDAAQVATRLTRTLNVAETARFASLAPMTSAA